MCTAVRCNSYTKRRSSLPSLAVFLHNAHTRTFSSHVFALRVSCYWKLEARDCQNTGLSSVNQRFFQIKKKNENRETKRAGMTSLRLRQQHHRYCCTRTPHTAVPNARRVASSLTPALVNTQRSGRRKVMQRMQPFFFSPLIPPGQISRSSPNKKDATESKNAPLKRVGTGILLLETRRKLQEHDAPIGLLSRLPSQHGCWKWIPQDRQFGSVPAAFLIGATRDKYEVL